MSCKAMLVTYMYGFMSIIHVFYVELFLYAYYLVYGNRILLYMAFLIILFKNFITMNHFDSRNHNYTEMTDTYYTLRYTNDIPTLTLNSSDPTINGKIQGKILYTYIRSLHYRTMPYIFLGNLFGKFPKPNMLIVPLNVEEEITSMINAYNSNNPWIKLTYETVIRWHMLPMACTTIVRKTVSGPVFSRNMDWLPFGKLAKYSLIVRYDKAGFNHFTIPGIIGVISGWNDNGLIIAMNVCNADNNNPIRRNLCRTMPAVFNNRLILERYSTVDELKDVTVNYKTKGLYRPYGAYHLTALDEKKKAVAISYLQGLNDTHVIRQEEDFSSENPVDIETYNHTYYNNLQLPGGRFMSDLRREIKLSNNHLSTMDLFKLYPINNWITCHTMHFYPDYNKVFIGFDNGFSAAALQNIYPFKNKHVQTLEIAPPESAHINI